MSAAAAAAAIRARAPLHPVPDCPAIRLHRATPASALGRLVAEAGDADRPPYWAYAWAGGLALARYLAERPETVAGRRVLDLGSGSGLVAIAAALAGAAQVVATDPDPLARIAIALNAAANGVAIAVGKHDADGEADLVLAGDVFYDAQVATDMLARLDHFLESGAAVLVGDPWRPALPLDRLRECAHYIVHETNGRAIDSGVFAFGPAIR